MSKIEPGETVDYTLTIDRQPVKNPVPFLVEGGDCGPCAISCVVGWDSSRLMDIYQAAKVDPARGRGISRHETWDILHEMRWNLGCVEDWVDDPLLPRPNKWFPGAFGYPGWFMDTYWADELRLRLRAGYLGLTVIDFEGRGAEACSDGDHWVVLAGMKGVWEPVEGCKGKRLSTYIRVLDSSTRRPGEWWMEVHDFLKKHGGFRVIYVRPSPPVRVIETQGEEETQEEVATEQAG